MNYSQETLKKLEKDLRTDFNKGLASRQTRVGGNVYLESNCVEILSPPCPSSIISGNDSLSQL